MGSTFTATGAVEMAGVAVARDLSGSRSTWVRGPVWDSFWMLSGLWLAPIVIWLAWGYDDPESSPLDLLYFGLTALFWLGHRFCSTYLAYCTEAYRPLLRTQSVRFVVLPVLITIGCFAFILPPDSALPWTRAERLVGLAIVDYAWVTWHFAAQHFGALSLYRSRAGRAACVQTRRIDRFFALSVGGALVFVADILAGAVAYQDQWIDRWFFPTWMVSAQDAIRGGATLVLVIVTVAALFAELRTTRWSLPRVLYINRHRGDGRHRSSSAKLVSFFGSLDFAALDSRSRTGVANAARRAGSQARCYSGCTAWIEHSAMGGPVVLNGAIGSAPPIIRSGSKPAGRHVLRRADIRRDRDRITDIVVGADARRPRFCNGVH